MKRILLIVMALWSIHLVATTDSTQDDANAIVIPEEPPQPSMQELQTRKDSLIAKQKYCRKRCTQAMLRRAKWRQAKKIHDDSSLAEKCTDKKILAMSQDPELEKKLELAEKRAQHWQHHLNCITRAISKVNSQIAKLERELKKNQ